MAQTDYEVFQERLYMCQTKASEFSIGVISDDLRRERQRQENLIKQIRLIENEFRESNCEFVGALKEADELVNGLHANIAALKYLNRISSLETTLSATSDIITRRAIQCANVKLNDGVVFEEQYTSQNVKENWKYVSRLAELIPLHTKNAGDYHQFNHDVNEINAILDKRWRSVASHVETFNPYGNLKEGIQMANDLKEHQAFFLHLSTRVLELQKQSHCIVPIHLRQQMSSYSSTGNSYLREQALRGRAMCNIPCQQFSIREGDELLVLPVRREDEALNGGANGRHRDVAASVSAGLPLGGGLGSQWYVRTLAGEEAYVPSVCVYLNGPDLGSMQAAIDLKRKLVTVWENTVKRFRTSLTSYYVRLLQQITKDQFLKAPNRDTRDKLQLFMRDVETLLLKDNPDQWTAKLKKVMEKLQNKINQGQDHPDAKLLRQTDVIQMHTPLLSYKDNLDNMLSLQRSHNFDEDYRQLQERYAQERKRQEEDFAKQDRLHQDMMNDLGKLTYRIDAFSRGATPPTLRRSRRSSEGSDISVELVPMDVDSVEFRKSGAGYFSDSDSDRVSPVNGSRGKRRGAARLHQRRLETHPLTDMGYTRSEGNLAAVHRQDSQTQIGVRSGQFMMQHDDSHLFAQAKLPTKSDAQTYIGFNKRDSVVNASTRSDMYRGRGSQAEARMNAITQISSIYDQTGTQQYQTGYDVKVQAVAGPLRENVMTQFGAIRRPAVMAATQVETPPNKSTQTVDHSQITSATQWGRIHADSRAQTYPGVDERVQVTDRRQRADLMTQIAPYLSDSTAQMGPYNKYATAEFTQSDLATQIGRFNSDSATQDTASSGDYIRSHAYDVQTQIGQCLSDSLTQMDSNADTGFSSLTRKPRRLAAITQISSRSADSYTQRNEPTEEASSQMGTSAASISSLTSREEDDFYEMVDTIKRRAWVDTLRQKLTQLVERSDTTVQTSDLRQLTDENAMAMRSAEVDRSLTNRGSQFYNFQDDKLSQTPTWREQKELYDVMCLVGVHSQSMVTQAEVQSENMEKEMAREEQVILNSEVQRQVQLIDSGTQTVYVRGKAKIAQMGREAGGLLSDAICQIGSFNKEEGIQQKDEVEDSEKTMQVQLLASEAYAKAEALTKKTQAGVGGLDPDFLFDLATQTTIRTQSIPTQIQFNIPSGDTGLQLVREQEHTVHLSTISPIKTRGKLIQTGLPQLGASRDANVQIIAQTLTKDSFETSRSEIVSEVHTALMSCEDVSISHAESDHHYKETTARKVQIVSVIPSLDLACQIQPHYGTSATHAEEATRRVVDSGVTFDAPESKASRVSANIGIETVDVICQVSPVFAEGVATEAWVMPKEVQEALVSFEEDLGRQKEEVILETRAPAPAALSVTKTTVLDNASSSSYAHKQQRIQTGQSFVSMEHMDVCCQIGTVVVDTKTKKAQAILSLSMSDSACQAAAETTEVFECTTQTASDHVDTKAKKAQAILAVGMSDLSCQTVTEIHKPQIAQETMYLSQSFESMTQTETDHIDTKAKKAQASLSSERSDLYCQTVTREIPKPQTTQEAMHLTETLESLTQTEIAIADTKTKKAQALLTTGMSDLSCQTVTEIPKPQKTQEAAYSAETFESLTQTESEVADTKTKKAQVLLTTGMSDLSCQTITEMPKQHEAQGAAYLTKAFESTTQTESVFVDTKAKKAQATLTAGRSDLSCQTVTEMPKPQKTQEAMYTANTFESLTQTESGVTDAKTKKAQATFTTGMSDLSCQTVTEIPRYQKSQEAMYATETFENLTQTDDVHISTKTKKAQATFGTERNDLSCQTFTRGATSQEILYQTQTLESTTQTELEEKSTEKFLLTTNAVPNLLQAELEKVTRAIMTDLQTATVDMEVWSEHVQTDRAISGRLVMTKGRLIQSSGTVEMMDLSTQAGVRHQHDSTLISQREKLSSDIEISWTVPRMVDTETHSANVAALTDASAQLSQEAYHVQQSSSTEEVQKHHKRVATSIPPLVLDAFCQRGVNAVDASGQTVVGLPREELFDVACQPDSAIRERKQVNKVVQHIVSTESLDLQCQTHPIMKSSYVENLVDIEEVVPAQTQLVMLTRETVEMKTKRCQFGNEQSDLSCQVGILSKTVDVHAISDQPVPVEKPTPTMVDSPCQSVPLTMEINASNFWEESEEAVRIVESPLLTEQPKVQEFVLKSKICQYGSQQNDLACQVGIVSQDIGLEAEEAKVPQLHDEMTQTEKVHRKMQLTHCGGVERCDLSCQVGVLLEDAFSSISEPYAVALAVSGEVGEIHTRPATSQKLLQYTSAVERQDLASQVGIISSEAATMNASSVESNQATQDSTSQVGPVLKDAATMIVQQMPHIEVAHLHPEPISATFDLICQIQTVSHDAEAYFEGDEEQRVSYQLTAASKPQDASSLYNEETQTEDVTVDRHHYSKEVGSEMRTKRVQYQSESRDLACQIGWVQHETAMLAVDHATEVVRPAVDQRVSVVQLDQWDEEVQTEEQSPVSTLSRGLQVTLSEYKSLYDREVEVSLQQEPVSVTTEAPRVNVDYAFVSREGMDISCQIQSVTKDLGLDPLEPTQKTKRLQFLRSEEERDVQCQYVGDLTPARQPSQMVDSLLFTSGAAVQLINAGCQQDMPSSEVLLVKQVLPTEGARPQLVDSHIWFAEEYSEEVKKTTTQLLQPVGHPDSSKRIQTVLEVGKACVECQISTLRQDAAVSPTLHFHRDVVAKHTQAGAPLSTMMDCMCQIACMTDERDSQMETYVEHFDHQAQTEGVTHVSQAAQYEPSTDYAAVSKEMEAKHVDLHHKRLQASIRPEDLNAMCQSSILTASVKIGTTGELKMEDREAILVQGEPTKYDFEAQTESSLPSTVIHKRLQASIRPEDLNAMCQSSILTESVKIGTSVELLVEDKLAVLVLEEPSKYEVEAQTESSLPSTVLHKRLQTAIRPEDLNVMCQSTILTDTVKVGPSTQLPEGNVDTLLSEEVSLYEMECQTELGPEPVLIQKTSVSGEDLVLHNKKMQATLGPRMTSVFCQCCAMHEEVGTSARKLSLADTASLYDEECQEEIMPALTSTIVSQTESRKVHDTWLGEAEVEEEFPLMKKGQAPRLKDAKKPDTVSSASSSQHSIFEDLEKPYGMKSVMARLKTEDLPQLVDELMYFDDSSAAKHHKRLQASVGPSEMDAMCGMMLMNNEVAVQCEEEKRPEKQVASVVERLVFFEGATTEKVNKRLQAIMSSVEVDAVCGIAMLSNDVVVQATAISHDVVVQTEMAIEPVQQALVHAQLLQEKPPQEMHNKRLQSQIRTDGVDVMCEISFCLSNESTQTYDKPMEVKEAQCQITPLSEDQTLQTTTQSISREISVKREHSVVDRAVEPFVEKLVDSYCEEKTEAGMSKKTQFTCMDQVSDAEVQVTFEVPREHYDEACGTSLLDFAIHSENRATVTDVEEVMDAQCQILPMTLDAMTQLATEHVTTVDTLVKSVGVTRLVDTYNTDTIQMASKDTQLTQEKPRSEDFQTQVATQPPPTSQGVGIDVDLFEEACQTSLLDFGETKQHILVYERSVMDAALDPIPLEVDETDFQLKKDKLQKEGRRRSSETFSMYEESVQVEDVLITHRRGVLIDCQTEGKSKEPVAPPVFTSVETQAQVVTRNVKLQKGHPSGSPPPLPSQLLTNETRIGQADVEVQFYHADIDSVYDELLVSTTTTTTALVPSEVRSEVEQHSVETLTDDIDFEELMWQISLQKKRDLYVSKTMQTETVEKKAVPKRILLDHEINSGRVQELEQGIQASQPLSLTTALAQAWRDVVDEEIECKPSEVKLTHRHETSQSYVTLEHPSQTETVKQVSEELQFCATALVDRVIEAASLEVADHSTQESQSMEPMVIVDEFVTTMEERSLQSVRATIDKEMLDSGNQTEVRSVMINVASQNDHVEKAVLVDHESRHVESLHDRESNTEVVRTLGKKLQVSAVSLEQGQQFDTPVKVVPLEETLITEVRVDQLQNRGVQYYTATFDQSEQMERPSRDFSEQHETLLPEVKQITALLSSEGVQHYRAALKDHESRHEESLQDSASNTESIKTLGKKLQVSAPSVEQSQQHDAHAQVSMIAEIVQYDAPLGENKEVQFDTEPIHEEVFVTTVPTQLLPASPITEEFECQTSVSTKGKKLQAHVYGEDVSVVAALETPHEQALVDRYSEHVEIFKNKKLLVSVSQENLFTQTQGVALLTTSVDSKAPTRYTVSSGPESVEEWDSAVQFSSEMRDTYSEAMDILSLESSTSTLRPTMVDRLSIPFTPRDMTEESGIQTMRSTQVDEYTDFCITDRSTTSQTDALLYKSVATEAEDFVKVMVDSGVCFTEVEPEKKKPVLQEAAVQFYLKSALQDDWHEVKYTVTDSGVDAAQAPRLKEKAMQCERRITLLDAEDQSEMSMISREQQKSEITQHSSAQTAAPAPLQARESSTEVVVLKDVISISPALLTHDRSVEHSIAVPMVSTASQLSESRQPLESRLVQATVDQKMASVCCEIQRVCTDSSSQTVQETLVNAANESAIQRDTKDQQVGHKTLVLLDTLAQADKVQPLVDRESSQVSEGMQHISAQTDRPAELKVKECNTEVVSLKDAVSTSGSLPLTQDQLVEHNVTKPMVTTASQQVESQKSFESRLVQVSAEQKNVVAACEIRLVCADSSIQTVHEDTVDASNEVVHKPNPLVDTSAQIGRVQPLVDCESSQDKLPRRNIGIQKGYPKLEDAVTSCYIQTDLHEALQTSSLVTKDELAAKEVAVKDAFVQKDSHLSTPILVARAEQFSPQMSNFGFTHTEVIPDLVNKSVYFFVESASDGTQLSLEKSLQFHVSTATEATHLTDKLILGEEEEEEEAVFVKTIAKQEALRTVKHDQDVQTLAGSLKDVCLHHDLESVNQGSQQEEARREVTETASETAMDLYVKASVLLETTFADKELQTSRSESRDQASSTIEQPLSDEWVTSSRRSEMFHQIVEMRAPCVDVGLQLGEAREMRDMISSADVTSMRDATIITETMPLNLSSSSWATDQKSQGMQSLSFQMKDEYNEDVVDSKAASYSKEIQTSKIELQHRGSFTAQQVMAEEWVSSSPQAPLFHQAAQMRVPCVDVSLQLGDIREMRDSTCSTEVLSVQNALVTTEAIPLEASISSWAADFISEGTQSLTVQRKDVYLQALVESKPIISDKEVQTVTATSQDRATSGIEQPLVEEWVASSRQSEMFHQVTEIRIPCLDIGLQSDSAREVRDTIAFMEKPTLHDALVTTETVPQQSVGTVADTFVIRETESSVETERCVLVDNCAVMDVEPLLSDTHTSLQIGTRNALVGSTAFTLSDMFSHSEEVNFLSKLTGTESKRIVEESSNTISQPMLEVRSFHQVETASSYCQSEEEVRPKLRDAILSVSLPRDMQDESSAFAVINETKATAVEGVTKTDNTSATEKLSLTNRGIDMEVVSVVDNSHSSFMLQTQGVGVMTSSYALVNRECGITVAQREQETSFTPTVSTSSVAVEAAVTTLVENKLAMHEVGMEDAVIESPEKVAIRHEFVEFTAHVQMCDSLSETPSTMAWKQPVSIQTEESIFHEYVTDVMLKLRQQERVEMRDAEATSIVSTANEGCEFASVTLAVDTLVCNAMQTEDSGNQSDVQLSASAYTQTSETTVVSAIVEGKAVAHAENGVNPIDEIMDDWVEKKVTQKVQALHEKRPSASSQTETLTMQDTEAQIGWNLKPREVQTIGSHIIDNIVSHESTFTTSATTTDESTSISVDMRDCATFVDTTPKVIDNLVDGSKTRSLTDTVSVNTDSTIWDEYFEVKLKEWKQAQSTRQQATQSSPASVKDERVEFEHVTAVVNSLSSEERAPNQYRWTQTELKPSQTDVMCEVSQLCENRVSQTDRLTCQEKLEAGGEEVEIKKKVEVREKESQSGLVLCIDAIVGQTTELFDTQTQMGVDTVDEIIKCELSFDTVFSAVGLQTDAPEMPSMMDSSVYVATTRVDALSQTETPVSHSLDNLVASNVVTHTQASQKDLPAPNLVTRDAAFRLNYADNRTQSETVPQLTQATQQDLDEESIEVKKRNQQQKAAKKLDSMATVSLQYAVNTHENSSNTALEDLEGLWQERMQLQASRQINRSVQAEDIPEHSQIIHREAFSGPKSAIVTTALQTPNVELSDKWHAWVLQEFDASSDATVALVDRGTITDGVDLSQRSRETQTQPRSAYDGAVQQAPLVHSECLQFDQVEEATIQLTRTTLQETSSLIFQIPKVETYTQTEGEDEEEDEAIGKQLSLTTTYKEVRHHYVGSPQSPTQSPRGPMVNTEMQTASSMIDHKVESLYFGDEWDAATLVRHSVSEKVDAYVQATNHQHLMDFLVKQIGVERMQITLRDYLLLDEADVQTELPSTVETRTQYPSFKRDEAVSTLELALIWGGDDEVSEEGGSGLPPTSPTSFSRPRPPSVASSVRSSIQTPKRPPHKHKRIQRGSSAINLCEVGVDPIFQWVPSAEEVHISVTETLCEESTFRTQDIPSRGAAKHKSEEVEQRFVFEASEDPYPWPRGSGVSGDAPVLVRHDSNKHVQTEFYGPVVYIGERFRRLQVSDPTQRVSGEPIYVSVLHGVRLREMALECVYHKGEPITPEEAIFNNYLSTRYHDEETGQHISLEEALRRNLVRKSTEDYDDKLLAWDVVQDACYEILDVLDESTQEFVSAQRALDQGLLNLNEGVYISSTSLLSDERVVDLREAIRQGLVRVRTEDASNLPSTLPTITIDMPFT